MRLKLSALLSQRNVKAVALPCASGETMAGDHLDEFDRSLCIPPKGEGMMKNLRLLLIWGLLFLPCLAFAGSQDRIRVAKVTLQAGMPQEKALQLLRRSSHLSVIEDHTNGYVIKDVKSGAILGSVEFKESTLVSASRNWGRPPSDQMASAPFANAVFEGLDGITGRVPSACTVDTRSANSDLLAIRNPKTGTTDSLDTPDAMSESKNASVACGKNRIIITVGIGRFGEFSYAVLKEFTYKGRIRVDKVTLEAGMPRDQALQALKSLTDISVTEIHELPNEAKALSIVNVRNDRFLWSLLLDESRVLNVSKYWILPGSDKLAPFANAVFEALDDLTSRRPSDCTVATTVTNPSLSGNPATGIASNISPNDILSEIKHVNISCGRKKVSISIGSTAAGDVSLVDIGESIFAK
jgi:hypothetical protein